MGDSSVGKACFEDSLWAIGALTLSLGLLDCVFVSSESGRGEFDFFSVVRLPGQRTSLRRKEWRMAFVACTAVGIVVVL